MNPKYFAIPVIGPMLRRAAIRRRVQELHERARRAPPGAWAEHRRERMN
jgi:hypothetical protein